MFAKRNSVRILMTAMLVVLPVAQLHAISVSVVNPGSNPAQAYAIGADITYNGNASWGGSDASLVYIQITLMYNDPRTGTYVDGETASTGGWNVNPGVSGSCLFSNPTSPTLTASQFQNNQTTYYFVATPYSASAPYFKNGQKYLVPVTLGSIS